MSDIFKDRERGFEADHFLKQDAKLLAKLRERAALSEVAQALAEKLKVDNAELLRHIVELGITRDTGAAVLLAPLVQVAWAEGQVTEAERNMVLSLAASRGIAPGSPAYAQLEAWLKKRPSDELFATALEAMKDGLAVLTEAERDERIKYIAEAAHKVAEASGGGLFKLLGLATGVSHNETAVLDAIIRQLRAGK
jgi:PAS domain-containing protein